MLACAVPALAKTDQTKKTPETSTASKEDSHSSKPAKLSDADSAKRAKTVEDASKKSKAVEAKTSKKTKVADESDDSKASKNGKHHRGFSVYNKLPDIQHERVDYWVAAFSKMHDYHKKIAAGFERKARYQGTLEKKLRAHGMPQNLIYLAFEESAFNPDAGSRAKAVGIWQLTPATARLYGLKVNKKVDERKNIEKETDAALKFLNHLHKRFGCWYLAAAAYDSGENRVARLMKKRFGREHGRDRDYYKLWDDLPGETRDYVPAIIALNRIGKDPKKYGF